MRGLHKFAAAEGLADIDVARGVKPPTPGRRLPKSLSYDDVIALLDGAGGDSDADNPLTLRNRALLELLYSTGARISEAVGLDLDDVDLPGMLQGLEIHEGPPHGAAQARTAGRAARGDRRGRHDPRSRFRRRAVQGLPVHGGGRRGDLPAGW